MQLQCITENIKCRIKNIKMVGILEVLTRYNVLKGTTLVAISLTLRRLMSYIYMEHPFLMFLDHTQRRSTVGRTPLDE